MPKALRKTPVQESTSRDSTSTSSGSEVNQDLPAQSGGERGGDSGGSTTPTLDRAASTTSSGSGGGASESGGGGGSGGASEGIDTTGVTALSGDGGGTRVRASSRKAVLTKTLSMGKGAQTSLGKEDAAPVEEAAPALEGVGGGPIDYTENPTDPPVPPEPPTAAMGRMGATELAQNTDQLGDMMAEHLDAVAAGQATGGVFSTGGDGEVGATHTTSRVRLTGVAELDGATAAGGIADAREAEERDPSHYKGSATYDPGADTGDIDVEEGPATPPSRGDWSDLPLMGDPGHSDWMMRYQMWWFDCIDAGGMEPGGGNNQMEQGDLPSTNHPDFEMLWWEYRDWWEQNVDGGEPSPDDLAALNLNLGGVSGTDEEMRFDADVVNVDEYLQQGADPERVNQTVNTGHAQADGMLATANADADAMKTDKFAEAEAMAGVVEADFQTALPDEAVIASPERPGDMQEYLDLMEGGTVEADVAMGFDERMAPGLEASWGTLEETVDGAVGDFETEREGAIDDGEAETERLAADAQKEQAEAFDQANADTEVKRQEIKDRQQAAIDEAKSEMDATRDAEFARIEAERANVQGEVDTKLNDAEQKVDSEVEKGKVEAEKAKEEGEKKKNKKRKWWQKLWDFVKKVVKWVVDQIKKVFNAVRAIVNTIVKAVVEAVTFLIDQLRQLVVGLIQALAQVLSAIIQATLGQIFPELAAELCAFIDTVAEVLTEAVNRIADTLIDTIETVADTVLAVINTALAITQFLMEAGLQAAMAAMSGEWGEFLLFMIESALTIAGISEEEFESYFGADPDVLQTVVDDPGGFMSRFGESFGMGFSQFGDNFGTHLKTGFFEWLTGGVSGAGIEIPDTWDFKGILKLVLSVLGISKGGILAKVKEFFGEKTAKIVTMLIDYGSAFKEDGLKGVIREISLDVTGTVREDVVDKAADDINNGGGINLLDSLLDLLDAFANGDGLDALMDFAQQDLGSILKDLVIDSIVNIVMEQVIKQAIIKLASLFNPVSALVQMLITAWNIFQSIKQVLDRIQAVVLTIVEGIIDVVLGNLQDVADNIEGALASLVPVAIELLAGVLGLGKLDDKIANALEGLRETVDKMIDGFFELIRGAVDSLVEMVRGWFDGNPQDEAGEGEGALMDPMGLDAGGGPVVYWVEAEDGSLKRVVQGDPDGLTEAWGEGVSAGIEGMGASEGEEYGDGSWNPDGAGSLEGWAPVSPSEVDPGDAAFTPGAMTSDAETPAAYLGDFATSAPSVQSATWPQVGTDMGGLASTNVDAVQGGLVPIEASIPGEATGGSADVELPVTGAAPTIDVDGPSVEDIPLPELAGGQGDDLSALAAALPVAPSLTDATSIDPGKLDGAADQGTGAARSAAESLGERIEAVAADEAIVPIAADHSAEVAALSQINVADTAPLAGMNLYASLSLPQDVHAQFDAMMQAESADSLGPAQGSLDSAETQRDTDVAGTIETIDADAKGLVEQAGVDQVAIMDEQRGAIAGAREQALAEQQAQLGSLEADLDTERSDRMSEVTFRLESDQNRLDSAYSDAKDQASSALADAEKSAADAEKEAEDPSWWDTLADYAQQAVDWLKDTISSIFEGLRQAVTVIFDTVTEVARSIIDEATAFITDALTSFGDFVQAAIQAFLGDVLPELADALCALVEAAVTVANDTMVSIAEKLKTDIDALALSLEAALNAALDVYEGAVQGALDLAQAALDGDWTEILVRVVEAVLELAGVDPAEFWALVGKADDTLQTILDDPGAFVSNAINAMGQGFGQFGENFQSHLEAGFLDWIGSNIGDIDLPDTFDIGGVLDITLQVLGLDEDGLRSKAEDRLGTEAVEVFDQVWGFIDAAIEGGLAGLWEHVQGELGDLWDSVIGGIQGWLIENVVMAAITKLASMFTPVGALVQAIKTVWEVYEFLQDKAAEIMEVVSGWVDSIADIANGSLDGAADRIEGALAGGLSLAIDLLANLMGLGGVGDRVQEIIDGIRGQVDAAIDALLDRLANVFRPDGDGQDNGDATEGTPIEVPMPETVHFEDQEQEDHRLWFEDGAQPELWVASDPAKVDDATDDGGEFQDIDGAEEAAVDNSAAQAEQHMKAAKDAGAEGKVQLSQEEAAQAAIKVLAVKNALAASGDGWDPATHDHAQHPLYIEFIERCDGIGYTGGDALFRTVLEGIGLGIEAGVKHKAGDKAEADLAEHLREHTFDEVANTLLAGRFDNLPDKPYALWSGGDYAQQVAQAAGYTILEMTDAGQIFDDLGLEVDGRTFELAPWEFLKPLWQALSRTFANSLDLNAPIHTFQRWVGGVYREVELEEIKRRAREAGIIDKIEMRYHALALFQNDSALDPFGTPSGTPLPSTHGSGSDVHCVDLSGRDGLGSRSAWLSAISEHEAACGTGINFTWEDFVAAVPGVSSTAAANILTAVDDDARTIPFALLESEGLTVEQQRAAVQFFLSKAIVVSGAPSSMVEDIDSNTAELPVEDWEPDFEGPLIEECLEDMRFAAADRNAILVWFDGAERWEAHPGDSLEMIFERAQASPGVHPLVHGMSKAQVEEALALIQGSDDKLSAEQMDAYRDLASELATELAAGNPLTQDLQDALLNVINEHIGQHLTANPVLHAAWTEVLTDYRANPDYAPYIAEDGTLVDMPEDKALALYAAARTKMNTRFAGIVAELEAVHGTLKSGLGQLPKGIHFHHLVQKKLLPSAAVNPRNLILCRGAESDDLHWFMHLLSAGTGKVQTKVIADQTRELLTNVLDI